MLNTLKIRFTFPKFNVKPQYILYRELSKAYTQNNPSKKVNLTTIVKGDKKAPFSIATTLRCRGGRYSFPWIDMYLIMSVKQGSIKYHFLKSLWYDATWEWTQVSQTVGKHSKLWASEPVPKWPLNLGYEHTLFTFVSFFCLLETSYYAIVFLLDFLSTICETKKKKNFKEDNR